MKHMQALLKAEGFRIKSDKIIVKLSKQLQTVIEDDDAYIVYQESDGWCVLFNDDSNVPIYLIDLDKILNSPKQEAIDALTAMNVA